MLNLQVGLILVVITYASDKVISFEQEIPSCFPPDPGALNYCMHKFPETMDYGFTIV